jgi:MFS family permease
MPAERHDTYQPTSNPVQNWPRWLKWTVLIQVSFMAFLGPYNAALINPSLVLLSKAMSVNTKVASYSTTTAILTGGLSPFFWTPLTNTYGRRPITLLAILITILGGVGSATAPDFSTLLGTRAVCGFGFGGMMSVGTAVVNDMFFLHERGEKTGVYSIFVTNGAHVAALGMYILISEACSRIVRHGAEISGPLPQEANAQLYLFRPALLKDPAFMFTC